jgi:hypothetical protein
MTLLVGPGPSGQLGKAGSHHHPHPRLPARVETSQQASEPGWVAPVEPHGSVCVCVPGGHGTMAHSSLMACTLLCSPILLRHSAAPSLYLRKNWGPPRRANSHARPPAKPLFISAAQPSLIHIHHIPPHPPTTPTTTTTTTTTSTTLPCSTSPLPTHSFFNHLFALCQALFTSTVYYYSHYYRRNFQVT